MQKIWAVILLSALASNFEALPQTKWNRPIRNLPGQLTRERRQFPFGEWIPLTQSCPTCRLFADPLDAGLRGENIGLTPPRPPTVTRQIHGEGNFFPQDESSILSVPPPPPSIATSNGNFQFSSFGQQFNSPPLPVPTQKIVPQTQQIQFFPQTFLPNQPLLVNGNQQILQGLNGQSSLFSQGQNQQQVGNGKVTSFQSSEFKTQKFPENVVLEQNKRPFANKAQPFTQTQQNQQQTFVQQQGFGGQRQHSVNFGNTILTPPPAPNNVSQDVVIPGLDKEEIQLLYVPVETLRQRGTPQEQLLTQQPQNIQFYNRPNSPQRPVNNVRPTEQTLTQPPKGHFVTQNGNNAGKSDGTLKVTSAQPFSSSVTPPTLLLQQLPFQETPQAFVSATPATPTLQSFVTPATVFQKFSPFTPETTLSQLSTVPSTIQFSQQSEVEFGTTPKTVSNQGVFSEEIINRKPVGFSKQEGEGPLQRPLQQSFISQQQVVTQQPEQQNAVFTNDHQKEIQVHNQFPNQIDQKQIALQKQQENQRLLQQQRQKELDEQRFLQEQRKQKELEEQRLLQQQRQKELEQQRFVQKQKELEEQHRLQQQQRQKELEQQRFLQKQKELEEQRLLQQQQQRQKELEQQRFLQKQKELEEQRLLQQQQQRQKELEQQRFLQKQKELEEQRLLQQQQRQRELEQQRYLQEQRQKELEYQRQLQLLQQKELEEKRLLQQLKQKEEEQQRALRFQQQQKELEQQTLLQAQRENQQRLLQQQKLQKQKQESLKNQQQFQLLQQQQKQNVPQQSFPQQPNRHVLPDNDKLNLIPQLEKESEPEDQQLVPHQPPLSVFFKGNSGADARITDVLRELRSSNTITVLDQYFEKMPKVFVGPAGLSPPAGYGKFDLPYLSNLESNRIERRIDKLPFFVAPLNFVPPPGYAKIPFPAPHVGSVVVSSESNPAMKLKSVETGIGQTSVEEENISGSYPVVGPELPGLINNLDTITTTAKPTTYVSTPSLPQTTAQLRNRRPNTSLYKPQNRKPITRTRSSTTSKPEEEVTQPIQKSEVSKDSEGIRKPFNRFLHRRRQQTKTTTESSLRGQQEGKSLENRFYSVEVYHQDKNQVPRTQLKSDVIRENPTEGQLNRQFELSAGSIDRITPGGHGVFEVHPTPDYSRTQQTAGPVESEERHPDTPDYFDVNLQTFEDGPLPTGSAKTITQELYRPNAIRQQEGEDRTLSKPDATFASDKFQPETYEDVVTTKSGETSDVSPTAAADTVSEEQVAVQPTSVAETEKQDASSERYEPTEAPRGEVSLTPGTVTVPEDHQTKGFLDSNEQYTSAFAEISKHHHIPGFADSSKRHPSTFPDVHPTSEISVDLQAPLSQDFGVSTEVRPTENAPEFPDRKFLPTGSTYEAYSTGFEKGSQSQQSDISSGHVPHVSPTAPGATEGEYTTGFSVNSQAQSSAQINRNSDDERTASFIGLHGTPGTENPQQYFPSSTSQSVATESNPVVVSHLSSTPEPVAEVTVSPSAQTYASGSVRDKPIQHDDQTQITESHGQDVADNLPNDYRLKLPNPSIVRVRTRVRGKSRGQVNFAASQSTTSAPYTRSGPDSRHNENADQDLTTKTNHFRDYQPVKISKYNQFRGAKKPVRPTTEATTEYDHKANVYTIRPQRRPLNPSTVSTKRIRRPTTPIPSVEAHTEVFGISTGGSYSQSEHSDISPSGVSNDVYYEQSSLSPVKNKFRKHFGPAAQKNDVVPVYSSTAFPSTLQSYSTTGYDGHSEESNMVRELAHTVAPQENSPDRYPEWNPSESGFDVSGIVLTTIRTTEQVEDHSEVEEPKKAQDGKKAFDPDLEKKTGRRRVRVRVHKRPHENFETAESQNLRTVANVLVPPTTTYKPNDESGFHQLAKNADFSFGGQKLFGLRSREYFRKRLNLNITETEGVGKGEQPVGALEEAAGKSSELVRKSQTNEVESSSAASGESSEGSKVARPKFRGFVRKIVKHGGARKEKESESKQVSENQESGSGEFHSRQPLRGNQGSFNHTGRVNGIKHKTFVRYVKKNKVRQHETESHVEPSLQEVHKEGEEPDHPEPESHTQAVDTQQTSTAESPVNKVQQAHEDNGQSQHQVTTEEPEMKETQQPSVQTTPADESGEIVESSSHADQELTSQTPSTTPLTQQSGLHFTQRPRFFQTLRPASYPTIRPVFQRTSQASLRTREPEASSSTTEQTVEEAQEKRNGYSRFKYGKTTGSSTAGTERTEEIKNVSEQQLRNKNLHTLEVKKYLRTKNREGAFSQFSRNRYFASEKTESESAKDEGSSEKESEELTTERNNEVTQTEPSSTEVKTTQLFARTDSTEIERETTKIEDELLQPTTTEAIPSSEEESSEEAEDEVTSSVNVETTTETEVPTTAFRASSTETAKQVTTEGTEAQTTDAQPDIYRFSKDSFSFDETEKFTGTKNRAWVRNITSDIIENTASFSAPGVEKRPDIHVVKQRADEILPVATESGKEKTEGATTESNAPETTTEYLETETTAAAEAITKAKAAKILKTSTTTKISHETEICYRGKCIRTKSENPDEDLKLLVDTASTVKIEKTET